MRIRLYRPRDNWLSPYTVLEKVFFWREIDYKEPIIERWSNRLYPLSVALKKVLDFFIPRDRVKIDPWDTWSMDTSLSVIILPLLRQLQDTKNGSAHVDDSDVPPELASTASTTVKENEWDLDEHFHARWNWVLDEMIWTFEQLQPDNDWEGQYYSEPFDLVFTRTHEGNFVVDSGDKHHSKVDYDGLKKHSDRIDRGLMLFGKYYRNLWD